MADEPDPLVEFLMEAAAEGALPHLQAALADADGRFTSNPRQAAVSALLAVADFLVLTREPGVEHMPALPGARVFNALALDLRALDDGHVSALLEPHAVGHNPKLPERAWISRLWAAVAVECRRLRIGRRGALVKASKEIERELGSTDAQTLRRWIKDFRPGGNAPVEFKRAFERVFIDACRTPAPLLLTGTDAEKRADQEHALVALESAALGRAKAWTESIGPDNRAT